MTWRAFLNDDLIAPGLSEAKFFEGFSDDKANEIFTGSPEVQETVRMESERRHEHGSQWFTIQPIATNIGCTAETLRRWVRQSETDQGKRSGISTNERERLKELEREVEELKSTNEIRRTASAFFAQAEPDRQPLPR